LAIISANIDIVTEDKKSKNAQQHFTKTILGCIEMIEYKSFSFCKYMNFNALFSQKSISQFY